MFGSLLIHHLTVIIPCLLICQLLRPDTSSPLCVYSDLPIWYEIVKRRFCTLQRYPPLSRERIVAKARFDPGKCQKEIFGPAHRSSGGPAGRLSGGPAHQVVKNEDATPLFCPCFVRTKRFTTGELVTSETARRSSPQIIPLSSLF